MPGPFHVFLNGGELLYLNFDGETVCNVLNCGGAAYQWVFSAGGVGREQFEQL